VCASLLAPVKQTRSRVSIAGTAPLSLEAVKSVVTYTGAQRAAYERADADGDNGSTRSTNTVADGASGWCYLVSGCWSSKPRDARLKTLASSRC
jgi:hypothetical protein